MTPYDSLPQGSRIDNAQARRRIENVDVHADTRFYTEDAIVRIVLRAVRGVTKSIVAAYRRRALEAQLRDLDDYMLADIGLKREEIPAFVSRRRAAEKAASPVQHQFLRLATRTDGPALVPAKDRPLAA